MLTWPSMSHDDQRAQLLTCQGQRPKSKPKTWQTNPTKEQHNRLCTSCGVESTHKAHSAAHHGKPPDMSAGRGIPKRQCTTQAQSKDNYGSTMRDAPSQQALGMVLPLCCFKMNGAPKSHNWQRHGGTAVHMCARHFYMRSLNSPSQQTPTHTRPTEKQRQKLPSVHAGSVGKAIPHGASCGLTLQKICTPRYPSHPVVPTGPHPYHTSFCRSKQPNTHSQHPYDISFCRSKRPNRRPETIRQHQASDGTNDRARQYGHWCPTGLAEAEAQSRHLKPQHCTSSKAPVAAAA
jgi:hypothetical protein